MNGFWWNGEWHPVDDSKDDGDEGGSGVREPRRPKPTAPAEARELVGAER